MHTHGWKNKLYERAYLASCSWPGCCFQGHVETIFDCKFKPDDPNLLATASFDGTIKIWDTNTLTAVNTSPGNEGVVYSLSWAPGTPPPHTHTKKMVCETSATRKKWGMHTWTQPKHKHPSPHYSSNISVKCITCYSCECWWTFCLCVCFEGDLNCIAGATSRNGAFIWDVRKGKIITRFNEVTLTHSAKWLYMVEIVEYFDQLWCSARSFESLCYKQDTK